VDFFQGEAAAVQRSDDLFGGQFSAADITDGGVVVLVIECLYG
jgi:hypothetical protein